MNFFGESSIANFLLTYMTATIVTAILASALYKLIGVWFPKLNGRLWPTITAITAAATTVFYWMVYERSANPIEYLIFAGVVMWALLYLSASNAKHLVERVTNMVTRSTHDE